MGPAPRWIARAIAACLFTASTLLGAPPPVAASSDAQFSGHWIDVDVSAHVATAYDGVTPVYRAPITAGKPGYESPVGTFRVIWRVANETMSSETLGVPRTAPEGYYLKNVRWVQYFTGGGFGLHSNYWQPDWVFGRANTSHGCIGMRESDAYFLWNFAGYGTPVVVHTSESVRVAPVVGKPVSEARASLEAAGLRVQVAETATASALPGTVVSQTPAGGLVARRGSVVSLLVAGSPPPPPAPASVRLPEGGWAWVPDVVGLPEPEARSRIEQAGLAAGYTNYQSELEVLEESRSFFRSVRPGRVLSAAPSAGERVARGSAVRLAVRKPSAG